MALTLPKSGFITEIIHLADIHIRCGDYTRARAQEYLEVFKQLFEELAQRDSIRAEEAVIVIAGDLFESKTQLQALTVYLFNEFINGLLNLAPVYIIQGNHDYRQECPEYSDIIRALLGLNKNPQLSYLCDTGLYYAGDVQFGVVSVRDTLRNGSCSGIVDQLPSIPQIDGNPRAAVLLFHGTVVGARMQNDQESGHSAYPLEWFENSHYDIGLFGDIHKQQIYGNWERNSENRTSNNPPKFTWGYSGSLIQQNFGEPLDGHGYLCWNLNTRKVSAHHVKNNYGFMSIRLNTNPEVKLNGAWCDLESVLKWPNIPSQITYCIKGRNTLDNRETISQLFSRTKVKATLNHVTDEVVTTESVKSSNDVTEVLNTEITEFGIGAETFIEFIESRPDYNEIPAEFDWRYLLFVSPEKLLIKTEDEKTAKYIDNKNRELRSCIQAISEANEPQIKNKFKICFLGWSYILPYGENCWINFRELTQKVCLINAPNDYGKSSIMEILVLGLYGDSMNSRYDAKHTCEIINKFKPQNKSASICVEFEVNRKLYRLNSHFKSREVKRERESRLIELVNGKEVLVREGNKAVNEWISDMIGSKDDFLMACLLTQNADCDFFSLKDQKAILSRVFNLRYISAINDFLHESVVTYQSYYNRLSDQCTAYKDSVGDIIEDEVVDTVDLLAKLATVESEIAKVEQDINYILLSGVSITKKYKSLHEIQTEIELKEKILQQAKQPLSQELQDILNTFSYSCVNTYNSDLSSEVTKSRDLIQKLSDNYGLIAENIPYHSLIAVAPNEYVTRRPSGVFCLSIDLANFRCPIEKESEVNKMIKQWQDWRNTYKREITIAEVQLKIAQNNYAIEMNKASDINNRITVHNAMRLPIITPELISEAKRCITKVYSTLVLLAAELGHKLPAELPNEITKDFFVNLRANAPKKSQKFALQPIKERLDMLKVDGERMQVEADLVYYSSKCNDLLPQLAVEYDNPPISVITEEEYTEALGYLDVDVQPDFESNELPELIANLEIIAKQLSSCSHIKINSNCDACLNNPWTIQKNTWRSAIEELQSKIDGIYERLGVKSLSEYEQARKNYLVNRTRCVNAEVTVANYKKYADTWRLIAEKAAIKDKYIESCKLRNESQALLNRLIEYENCKKSYEEALASNEAFDRYMRYTEFDNILTMFENQFLALSWSKYNTQLNKELVAISDKVDKAQEELNKWQFIVAEKERENKLLGPLTDWLKHINKLFEAVCYIHAINSTQMQALKAVIDRDDIIQKNNTDGLRVMSNLWLLNEIKTARINDQNSIKAHLTNIRLEQAKKAAKLEMQKNIIAKINYCESQLKTVEVYLKGLTLLKKMAINYGDWVFINKLLPTITNQVNSLLTILMNDKTTCQLRAVVENNNIHWLQYNGVCDVGIEKCGGFYRALISFLFRIVIQRMGSGIRVHCAQLLLDEAFVSADTDNLSRIPGLIQRLVDSNSMFESILIVSHQQILKDSCVCVMDITKDDKFSILKYGAGMVINNKPVPAATGACIGQKKDGSPCSNRAKIGSYCGVHAPKN